MDYIVVPALPRKASVEWQVWIHTHNNKFECKFQEIWFWLKDLMSIEFQIYR